MKVSIIPYIQEASDTIELAKARNELYEVVADNKVSADAIQGWKNVLKAGKRRRSDASNNEIALHDLQSGKIRKSSNHVPPMVRSPPVIRVRVVTLSGISLSSSMSSAGGITGSGGSGGAGGGTGAVQAVSISSTLLHPVPFPSKRAVRLKGRIPQQFVSLGIIQNIQISADVRERIKARKGRQLGIIRNRKISNNGLERQETLVSASFSKTHRSPSTLVSASKPEKVVSLALFSILSHSPMVLSAEKEGRVVSVALLVISKKSPTLLSDQSLKPS